MALFCEALRAAAVACFPGDMGGGLPGVRVRAARSGEFALPELLPEFSGELPELLPEFSGELPE